MNREILCNKCEPRLRALFPSSSPYPDEHVKFVNGKAKDGFICDSCGQPIKIGDNCTAMSIWTDLGGVAYSEWESGYLQINGNKLKIKG